MAEITRVLAKTYFETGDVPTAAQFIDVFDSVPFAKTDSVFTALSGTAWDGSYKTVTLSANTVLTFSSTKKSGCLIVTQDATGARTLSINGTAATINTTAASKTLITFIYDEIAAAYIFSIDTSILGVSGGGNTTPAAPGVVADDGADTLSFTHALGTSEIEVSIDNGAYGAYAGPYAVGNVARAAGYWKARTIQATGRNASAVTDSPAFTVAGGALLHQSLFTAANGTLLSAYTPETGNAWVDPSPDVWEIQSNSGTTKSATGPQWDTFTEVAATNYVITAIVNKAGGTAIQFSFRVTDAANLVVVSIDDTAAAGGIFNQVAGVYTSFGTWSGLINDALDHTVELTVSGTSLTVKVDAVTVGTGTIPAGNSGTKIGMGQYNGAAGGVGFKSITVA